MCVFFGGFSYRVMHCALAFNCEWIHEIKNWQSLKHQFFCDARVTLHICDLSHGEQILGNRKIRAANRQTFNGDDDKKIQICMAHSNGNQINIQIYEC